jgi:hypothetical protein
MPSPFPALQFPVNRLADHVQAILPVLAGGVQPVHGFLRQRHQNPLIPEFLASHVLLIKPYIRY